MDINLEDLASCAHACSSRIQNAIVQYRWREDLFDTSARPKNATAFLEWLADDGRSPQSVRVQALNQATDNLCALLAVFGFGGTIPKKDEPLVVEINQYLSTGRILKEANQHVVELMKLREFTPAPRVRRGP